MLFLGMFPRLNHGRLKLMALSQAHAATFSDEDGDNPGDPDDPENPDPCDGGSSYPTTTSTISGNITTLTTCSYNYDGCGNYIGYSCDGGVQCGISSAGISLSETSGNILDEVILTASSTVVGSPNIQYEFQQTTDDGTTWFDVGNDPGSSSFTYTIDEGGINGFRVIESCDCSIAVASAKASFTTNSNDYDFVKLEAGPIPNEGTIQFQNTCVPTTIAEISAYYGGDLNPLDIAIAYSDTSGYSYNSVVTQGIGFNDIETVVSWYFNVVEISWNDGLEEAIDDQDAIMGTFVDDTGSLHEVFITGMDDTGMTWYYDSATGQYGTKDNESYTQILKVTSK